MSVDKRELLDLQAKARKAGRVCNFFFSEEGHMTSVFYGANANRGRVTSLLSFAEQERKMQAVANYVAGGLGEENDFCPSDNS